jgi:hypothetical protein
MAIHASQNPMALGNNENLGIYVYNPDMLTKGMDTVCGISCSYKQTLQFCLTKAYGRYESRAGKSKA